MNEDKSISLPELSIPETASSGLDLRHLNEDQKNDLCYGKEATGGRQFTLHTRPLQDPDISALLEKELGA